MSDTILSGRYQLLERIGGGGMAVVYRSLDTILNRFVSVKILRSQFASDEEFVRRFRREAQAAASLSHPNIVNIYDVGTDGETHYIVMEYIDGFTLKELIDAEAPLAADRSIQITKQICAALKHAHDNKIVHRDIKPHNILIGRDGRVKVTDFGIARATTSNTVTHTGSVLGSVHYFSPEQARGGITDVKSDIYSLGVVLYEMVTGSLPFSGESPVSVALKHLQDDFVEPRVINPALPQSIENIILKSLTKDPAYRYGSMQEMISDLDSALQRPNVPKFVAPVRHDQDTIQIPAVGLKQANAGVYPPGDEPRAGSRNAQAPRRKRRWLGIVLWPLGILLALSFAAAAGYEIVTFMSGNFSVKQTTMPNLRGMSYADAVKTLTQAGFKPDNIQKSEAYPADAAAAKIGPGQVFDQDPKAGSTVKLNHPVLLIVSKGAQTVSMPSLAGLSQDDAKKALAAANISDSQIHFQDEYSSDVKAGFVTRQTPDAASAVAPGSPVTVYISQGKEMATMPDLTGLTLDQANNKLKTAGFYPNNVTYQSSDKPKNTVISQSPFAPQSQAPKGASEDLVLSGGPANQTKTFIYSQDVQVDRKTKVQIKKTDSVDQGAVVFNQTISSPQKVPISITLKTPDDVATIEVYKDGVLASTQIVPYPQD